MTAVVTGREAPAAVPAPADGPGRLAHALAALRAAEQRTGVRRPGPRPTADQPAERPADLPADLPAERPAGLPTERPADRPGNRRAEAGVAAGRSGAADRHWPVHPDLAALLPGGVLPAGGTLAVRGSTSLLLALLAAASGAGAWVAFVGAPAVGMLAAADAGVELERVALVPDPGPDAPAAVAALLDGMDVVVVGPRAALLDADRRRLAARARERGTLLVPTTAWTGAHVTLDARGGTWSGVDRGAGWLRRRTLSVLRTGRGAAARPAEIDVEVPLRTTVVVPGRPSPLVADRPVAEPVTDAGRVDAPAAPAAGRPRLRVA